MLSKLFRTPRPYRPNYGRLDGGIGAELSILAGASSIEPPYRKSPSAEEVLKELPESSPLPPLKGNFLSQRFSGWRFGALLAALLSLASLGLNIGAVVWLARHTKLHRRSKLVGIYRGDCSTAERLDTYIHFAINVLGTLLLSGSNYVMQCLVAPTRDMVDKAHAKAKWLDIGIPGVRNLRSVSITSTSLWLALLLSSVPLHLVYNSAVYSFINANTYKYAIMTQGYFDKFDLNNASSIDMYWTWNATSYERLENADCLRAYAKDFVEDRGNVIVVVKNPNDTRLPTLGLNGAGNTIVPEYHMYHPYPWLCEDSNSRQKYKLPLLTSEQSPSDSCYLWIDQIQADPQNWALGDDTVDHCLSQRTKEFCGLNGNIPIILTVIVCNVIKCAIMFYVALGFKFEPLIVVGDAVASFLLRPDGATVQAALLSREDVVGQSRRSSTCGSQQEGEIFQKSKIFRDRHPRRFTAASKRRWSVNTGLCVVSIIVILALLVNGIVFQLSQNRTIAAFWKLGFGKVNSQTLITGSNLVGNKNDGSYRAILTVVLLANIPQPMLSILYFNLNSLVTSICLAAEWAQFSTTRKSLRTSAPRTGQRSTYFLSIPYRYGIPMLMVSTILHWLVSQSLFLAVVTEAQPGVKGVSLLVATCGYSPMAIISAVIVGSLLLTATLAMGLPRIKAQIPLVGSCSLAISAACHLPESDKRAAFEPVMWGVVPGMVDEDGVAHCAFTSGPVQKLEVGVRYRT